MGCSLCSLTSLVHSNIDISGLIIILLTHFFIKKILGNTGKKKPKQVSFNVHNVVKNSGCTIEHVLFLFHPWDFYFQIWLQNV